MSENQNNVFNLSGLTPDRLIEMDTRVAEKMFNRMPLAERRSLVLSASWKDRVELILMDRNPAALVRALPEEELYWTVKMYGETDSLQLLSMTSHDQMQYIFDVEVWRKDVIDTESLENWLGILSRLSEEKVVDWFFNFDPEFVTGALKKMMQVFKVEADNDLSEEYLNLPYYTMDGVYFLKFLTNDAEVLLKPMLHVLYEYDSNRFYGLLETIIWDSSVEDEEAAFGFKQNRLAEKGFPSVDEALAVYQLISDTEAASLKNRISGSVQRDNSVPNNALIPFSFHGWQETFLFRVMRRMSSEPAVEGLCRSITGVANRVMTADGRVPKEMEELKTALFKASGYVNIGVEQLSGSDPETAIAVLENLHPLDLFRAGHTAVWGLKQRAETLFRENGEIDAQAMASFLDSPWSETVQSLRQRRPEFYEGAVDETSLQRRDFQSLKEVAAVSDVIDMVQAVLMLFKTLFKEAFARHVHKTTAIALFNTAAALNLLGISRPGGVFLKRDELATFMDDFVKKNEGKRLYSDIIKWLSGISDDTGVRMKALERFVGRSLSDLENEFSEIVNIRETDPKYIQAIIVI